MIFLIIYGVIALIFTVLNIIQAHKLYPRDLYPKARSPLVYIVSLLEGSIWLALFIFSGVVGMYNEMKWARTEKTDG